MNILLKIFCQPELQQTLKSFTVTSAYTCISNKQWNPIYSQSSLVRKTFFADIFHCHRLIPMLTSTYMHSWQGFWRALQNFKVLKSSCFCSSPFCFRNQHIYSQLAWSVVILCITIVSEVLSEKNPPKFCSMDSLYSTLKRIASLNNSIKFES